MANRIIVVSGGLDPIHIGHLRMLKSAKALGDKLIVILNNDSFLLEKKGYAFMNQHERKEIIESFDFVDEVFISIDKDNTVRESLKEISKTQKISVFANGGDRREIEDIPESKTCQDLGIDMIFEVGGGKIQSSSDLVKKEIHKPWGSYSTFEKNRTYLVKRITVEPGKRLSLQSHEHRSEFWIVAQGTALVTIENEERVLNVGESIVIGKQQKHRLSNTGESQLELIEIQFGTTLDEDDIVRYQDDFGR